MLDSENDDNPSDEKREVIKPWKKTANEYCLASIDILENAKEYMKKLELKHKDAIHLACAVKHKCDYLITTVKSLKTRMVLFKKSKLLIR